MSLKPLCLPFPPHPAHMHFFLSQDVKDCVQIFVWCFESGWASIFTACASALCEQETMSSKNLSSKRSLRCLAAVCTHEMGIIITRVHAAPSKELVCASSTSPFVQLSNDCDSRDSCPWNASVGCADYLNGKRDFKQAAGSPHSSDRLHFAFEVIAAF